MLSCMAFLTFIFTTAALQHIFEDGHAHLELPSVVLGTWCLPAPIESLTHGLRIRLLCRHRVGPKATLNDERRYKWMEIQNERVLESLTLLPDQFQPTLYLL